MRSIYSLVHAKSLGLWPTPTALTVLPSRLANSTMSVHWYSVVGSKTASGLQVKVRPQFVKVACGEEGWIVIGLSRLYKVVKGMRGRRDIVGREKN